MEKVPFGLMWVFGVLGAMVGFWIYRRLKKRK
jgi:hypothetical protein